MKSFIQEIRTVILMVDFFIEKGSEQEILGKSSKEWKVSLATRLEQRFELVMLLKDVVKYYLMVTDPEADRGALALSMYFLERMAFAGATNHSDRIVVGSMCAMMLQQVFGHGLAVDNAIRQYEEAEDPLAFAVMVASSGNHAIPLSATTQQIRASLLAVQQRTTGSYYKVSDGGALMSQWPQPMPGRCYAGTLTSSPWKSIFWHALNHNRGLGLEHDLEKAKSSAVVKSTEYKDHEVASVVARKRHFRRRSRLAFAASRVGKNADIGYLMWDPTHPKNGVYVPLDDTETLARYISSETREVRLRGLDAVIDAWNKSQSALLPVIGERLPVLIDGSSGIVALYAVDARGIEGNTRKIMETSDHPLVVAEVDSSEISLEDVESSVDIHEHPLLQLVLSLPAKGEQDYLIGMRRVWNPVLAGGMPADPEELRKQKVEKRWGDANGLLQADGSKNEVDWIFPTRVIREQLADYTHNAADSSFEVWHAPGMMTHYAQAGGSAKMAPKKWKRRWTVVKQTLQMPWELEIGPWQSDQLNASPSNVVTGGSSEHIGFFEDSSTTQDDSLTETSSSTWEANFEDNRKQGSGGEIMEVLPVLVEPTTLKATASMPKEMEDYSEIPEGIETNGTSSSSSSSPTTAAGSESKSSSSHTKSSSKSSSSRAKSSKSSDGAKKKKKKKGTAESKTKRSEGV